MRLQGNRAVQTSARRWNNDDIVVDRTIARGHWPWCVLVLIVRFRAKTHAPLVESDDVSCVLKAQLFVAFECRVLSSGLRFRLAHVSAATRAPSSRSNQPSWPEAAPYPRPRRAGPVRPDQPRNPQPRQGHHCLFEILRMGRPVHAGFRDRAYVESPLGLTHGRRMRARRLAKLALHRGGNVIDGIANGGN